MKCKSIVQLVYWRRNRLGLLTGPYRAYSGVYSTGTTDWTLYRALLLKYLPPRAPDRTAIVTSAEALQRGRGLNDPPRAPQGVHGVGTEEDPASLTISHSWTPSRWKADEPHEPIRPSRA